MQISQKIQDERQDILIEEFLREKAAVLARAGFAVEDAIKQLLSIERELEEKKSLLNLSCPDDRGLIKSRDKQLICEEINRIIDKFNLFHKKAETQYYYLIVTREALGLRRHEMIQKMYRIPDRKKNYELDNG
jgi:hypothetical protein